MKIMLLLALDLSVPTIYQEVVGMPAFFNTKTGRGIVLVVGLLAVVSLGYWPVIALITVVGIACASEVLSFTGLLEKSFSNRVYMALMIQMWLVCVGAYSAARIMNGHDVWLVMVIVVAVYVENAAAQIFGKRFGRTKLFPRHSPKKTVAGAVWGWAFGSVAGVVALGLAWWFGGFGDQIMANWKEWLTIVVIAPPLAEIGDWLESRTKRLVGVKDSGELVAASPSRIIRTIGLSAVFGKQGGALDKTDSLWSVILAAHVVLMTSWHFGVVIFIITTAITWYFKVTALTRPTS